MEAQSPQQHRTGSGAHFVGDIRCRYIFIPISDVGICRPRSLQQRSMCGLEISCAEAIVNGEF
jgi:hypothetical protein